MFKGFALLFSAVLWLSGYEAIAVVLMVNIVMIMELEEKVIKQMITSKPKVKRTNKSRRVRIYNENGYDKTYNSAIMACRDLGLSSGNLSNVINGKFKHTRGYQAEYID